MANKNYLLNDKFPKAIKNATSTSDGLMSSLDKSRLDSVFEFGLLSPVTHEKDGIMVKEDKIKLDGIEENANNYIHPDNPNTRHVSDDEKTKWNNQTKYTNLTPTPTAIGGIEKGTTFDKMDVTQVLNRLLYPYLNPTISNISITPSTTILELGSSFNITRVKFNINSESIASDSSINYTLILNGTSLSQFTGNKVVDKTINTIVNSTSTLSVKVDDVSNNKQFNFNLITYKFIYPMYYGIINNSDTINNTLIKSKTKLLQEKGTKTLKFTTNNQKMIFAYPKSYGKLSTIYDANNFNILNTFAISEVNVTANDGNTVVYYVYCNDSSSVSNYSIKFVY